MEIHNLGATATFSMSSKTKPWLWELLSRCTRNKCWKAAVYQENFIVSLYVGEKDNKKKKHKLLTNDFHTTASSATTSTLTNTVPLNQTATFNESTFGSSPVYTQQYLELQTVAQLRSICATYNIKPGKKEKLI